MPRLCLIMLYMIHNARTDLPAHTALPPGQQEQSVFTWDYWQHAYKNANLEMMKKVLIMIGEMASAFGAIISLFGCNPKGI